MQNRYLTKLSMIQQVNELSYWTVYG